LAHRNVIRDGFGDLDVKVDSVFLDLPAPWDALEESKRVMNVSNPDVSVALARKHAFNNG
jgi:tRNA A58 N-methylase Trm61